MITSSPERLTVPFAGTKTSPFSNSDEKAKVDCLPTCLTTASPRPLSSSLISPRAPAGRARNSFPNRDGYH